MQNTQDVPTTMNSLENPDLEIGFNWHPAVHTQHFGETLYFVMIRFREPLHRPVARQLRDLLAAVEIEYACEYPLFGYWDALVRVWLGQSSYRRLVRTLREKKRNNIADVRGFTVVEIDYLRLSKRDDPLSADQDNLLATITTYAAAIDRLSESPDRPDIDEYQKMCEEGLLFDCPPPPDQSVKFYTALTRTSDEASPERDINAILRAMDATIIPTSNVRMTDRATLYLGSGELADYLIRCVADRYSDVLALVEAFDIHIKETNLRPMTLLVASSSPRESDNANDRLHLTLDDANAAELLGFDNPSILAKLKDDHRHEFRHLIKTACELSDTDDELRNKLLRALRATLENQSADLEQELIFLHRFEPKFNKAIEDSLIYVFDDDWRVKVKDMCLKDKRWHKHAAEIERLETSNAKWTIGTYLTTATAVSESDPGFQGLLEKRFQSDNWEKETRALLDLRNKFSHGDVSLFERLDFYDGKMVKFLVSVINAGVLSRRCERIFG
jgi:hypothetical protein